MIRDVEGWEQLAGWLDVSPGEIREVCNRESDWARCYRRRLVEIYCDRTAKPPQQVTEDMAKIFEDRIKNKRVADKLRLLTFGK